VKGALKDFRRPDLLADNPLMRSHLMAARRAARPADLPALLIETSAALFSNPRDSCAVSSKSPSGAQAGSRSRTAEPFVRYLSPTPHNRDSPHRALAVGSVRTNGPCANWRKVDLSGMTWSAAGFEIGGTRKLAILVPVEAK
jgi:hypothetical protein